MSAVPDSEDSRASCLCKSCPSKPEGDMVLHCVTGKSPAPVTRGFCACSWCPVWSCYALAGSFFCDEGPAGGEDTGGGEGAADVDAASGDDPVS